MINEEFLQFIWRNKLFKNKSLRTIAGENVEIINVGETNNDAGPDFFNAKIKTNNTIWAGNVEIHVNSSDWYKHSHHLDKSYDNVILQVVKKYDKEIFRSNGESIPTIELKYSDDLFCNYNKLLKSENWIPCEKKFGKVDKFLIDFWLNSLTIERLEKKSNEIRLILERNKNNWEETFYQYLAKNFGFKVNSQPFEMLAKSIPLKYLAKHKNNLLQLEAILFGQAGMLSKEINDNYYLKLQKEYYFLKNKFQLVAIDEYLWKFLRIRPSNFPTIRIAQFANLVYKSSGLFSKIIEIKNFNDIKQLFEINASEYWDCHYTFTKKSKKRKKQLGNTAFNNIIINTIIPFLFIYSKAKDNELYKDLSLKFLEELPAENNSIISNWKSIGIKVPNAYYSQSLIQLKNEYCKFKKCLQCQIGNKIIKNNLT
ncbi:MAG: DUF2851 family protein [Bacteroidales bacterium]|nr:DUF2851 family protein [Bacteroidales bacterium]